MVLLTRGANSEHVEGGKGHVSAPFLQVVVGDVNLNRKIFYYGFIITYF